MVISLRINGVLKSEFRGKLYIYIDIKKKEKPPKRGNVGVEEVTSSRPWESRPGVRNLYL